MIASNVYGESPLGSITWTQTVESQYQGRHLSATMVAEPGEWFEPSGLSSWRLFAWPPTLSRFSEVESEVLWVQGVDHAAHLLKAKIHRARITATSLDYEGSLSIDRNLMVTAGIAPHEQVGVYNLPNGERFDPYAIAAPQGSGEVRMNGAAVRKGQPGDLVIITTYALLGEKEMANHQPRVMLVDEGNRPRQGGGCD